MSTTNELKNCLLSRLSRDDFRAVAPHLESLKLAKGQCLASSGEPITHYYFLESGIGSMVATSPEGLKAEVGLVGRDGVLPISAIIGGDTTTRDIFMQVEGHGHRIETDALNHIMDSHAGVRDILLRFVQTLWAQTTFTALSNAVHHIEERLARWILMCHDRISGDEIPLTHEYISIMLAVRRPSVTNALHILEGRHLIYSTRGLVTVRDRSGLEDFAADAYGVPEREYERLLGPLK